jgi:HEPN domain-containing protein
MPPEMELVRQWIERARTDLRSAAHALSANPPLTEDACFHAQQAIEKSLKAFLVHRDVEFEWSHRIRYLLNLCAQCDTSFSQWRDEAEPLTEYAVQFRYPHPDPAPTVGESNIALNVAQRIHQFVLEQLPAELRRGSQG